MNRRPVRSSRWFWMAVLALPLWAGVAQGQPKIGLPDLLAVELPEGVAELAPGDPPLRELLASAAGEGRRVTADLRRKLGVGAARVTWSVWAGEPEVGTPLATRAATVFVLPHGMTPAGVSADENATAGNNAVHIARDAAGRAHMVWIDGGRPGAKGGPMYRRGGADGHFESPPFMFAEGVPADWNAYPGLFVSGENIDVVWQGGGRAWTRRLSPGAGGLVWGPARDTGAKSDGRDVGPAIASDGKMVHVVTPSGVYAFSADGGQTWRTEQVPVPPGQTPKTASLALDSAGTATVVFSSVVATPKNGATEGTGGYWQLRIVQRLLDGRWVGAADALGEFPVWGEPLPRQDILADWVRVGVDRFRGLHLTWHGTATSHLYANDHAYYAYKPSGSGWRQPVTLFPPNPGLGIKFSFAPSLTVDGERAFATVFYDVFAGERWGGFDAVAVPLYDGAPVGAPLPVSQFVRGAIDKKTPEFALSTRFPAAAPSLYRGADGRTWLDLLETLVPMGVPDAAKLIVWHRVDVGAVAKR